ncbi:hypothetical protein GCM10023183_03100 [Nibribacter koreensis]|uniref:Uncharacterized protein n=1 Tax=Nibribacter koreensis TaxID=1084519 RepID=A0ABP8F772_9BACT
MALLTYKELIREFVAKFLLLWLVGRVLMLASAIHFARQLTFTNLSGLISQISTSDLPLYLLTVLLIAFALWGLTRKNVKRHFLN